MPGWLGQDTNGGGLGEKGAAFSPKSNQVGIAVAARKFSNSLSIQGKEQSGDTRGFTVGSGMESNSLARFLKGL